MFGTFVKYQFQRTYDAILAAPADTEELVTAEVPVAGYSKSFENLNYIVGAVLTPLSLLAGSFFPLDAFPRWAQILAAFNPIHHTVVLVRDAVFGLEGWEDLLRVGYLILSLIHI